MGEGLWPGAAELAWIVAATLLCSKRICFQSGLLLVEVTTAALFGAETLTHIEF